MSTASSTGYNLARFDLVSVRLAVACAHSGSLTAAARSCNLVLSAASRRIRELEASVGDVLFERHSRGLVATNAGRAFARRGFVMLQEFDNLIDELADMREGVVRHVRLCASTAAINGFLSPILAKFGQSHSDLRIDVEEQLSDLVVSALREFRADIGVFVAGCDIEGLETRELYRDELVLILPVGHRLAGESPIHFHEALDEQWISLNTGAALLRTQQQAAHAAGRSLKLRAQVRSFDTVAHLVAAHLGIAILPKHAVLPIVHAMELTWRPLADVWAHRTILVGLRHDADETVLKFRDYLCQHSQIAKSP